MDEFSKRWIEATNKFPTDKKLRLTLGFYEMVNFIDRCDKIGLTYDDITFVLKTVAVDAHRIGKNEMPSL